MTLKLIVTGIFFIIAALTGIWITRTGKPYNTVVFNIHKLISLAAIAFSVVIVYQLQKGAGMTQLQWLFCIITALFVVTSLISGGMLSVEKPAPKIIHLLHTIAPVFIAAGTAVVVYLLLEVRK